MTIQEAIEEYKKLGPEAIYPGYRDAIEVLAANHVKTPLENDSYLDALFLTHLMFQRTGHCLNVLTGSSVDMFLEVLQQPFSEALSRIKKTNGKARMIILDGKLPPALAELLERYKNTFEVRLGRAKAPISHFIVCDSGMARIEEPHEPLTPQTDCTAVKAKVFFDNADVTQERIGFFEAAWSRLGNA